MKKIKTLALVVLTSCFVCSNSSAHPDFSILIKKTKPYVVTIEASVKRAWSGKKRKAELDKVLGDYSDYYNDEFRKSSGVSKGTGFLIRPPSSVENWDEIYILTAAHVIDGAKKIKVVFPDGRKATAKLVWASNRDDVALLAVAKKGIEGALSLRELPIEEGIHVLSISNAFGVSLSSSTGIVSALDVKLKRTQPFGYLQTDAALNRGSSGGPLFDSEGKVVGLVSVIYSNTGAFSGAAFAVPASRLTQLLNKKGFGDKN